MLKNDLSFCKEDNCFEEKQEGLEICATHYQKGVSNFVNEIADYHKKGGE